MANNLLNNLFGGLTGGAGGRGTTTTSPPGRSSLFDDDDIITDFTDHPPLFQEAPQSRRRIKAPLWQGEVR